MICGIFLPNVKRNIGVFSFSKNLGFHWSKQREI